MTYCFDASTFIHLWNEMYPKKTFPSLYRELENHSKKIILIKAIFDEIKEDKSLTKWLKSMQIEPVKLKDEHDQEALNLESKYKIKINSTGVGKSDIKLIAYSKIEKHIVVTQEQQQKQSPADTSKYRIPLVCNKERMDCINFLEFLEQNDIII